MLEALADDLVRGLRKARKLRGRLEGKSQEGWILVDYGDLVVHLFSPDRRDFYNLEELWGDGKVLLRVQ
jgi:ribosome-associated protein